MLNKRNDHQAKDFIIRLLESRNYKVVPIKETDSPTPDLFVSDKNHTYFIEIKTKFDQSLYTSDVRLDKVHRLNRLSGIVKKGTKQLKSVQKDETINLIWFVVDPDDCELIYKQIQSTVYGIRIVVAKRNDISAIKHGYYVTYNDFFRYRDVLDGIALGEFNGFLLNNHSPRFSVTKECHLIGEFGEAVLNPLDLEKHDDIYVIDCDVDRHDESAVIQFLENKYGISIIEFTDFTRFSVSY